MIIESIRLRNIKSYLEGPDGQGVLVRFENGVNRVAGRNGHGKTTLIESLGYTLFLTEPQFDENFHIETYFLSHGAREGDIEVTVSCDGERYRIERPVGKQSKRRSKVVQLSDNSICAEDREVPAFLCRLLKFPDCNHLSEVFCKLIGVKQGRLTWPFDSKPSVSKSYFEPLFNVEVFRLCFDRLKESVDIFHTQRNGHREKLAGIQVAIQERGDSAEKLQAAREAAGNGAATLQAAEILLREARLLKENCETAEQTLGQAKHALNSASQRRQHAVDLRDAAEKDVLTSRTASELALQNRPAHDAYSAAELALQQLNARRAERDLLRQRRDQAENETKIEEQRATAARDQATAFSEQRDARKAEADSLAAQSNTLLVSLRATAESFAGSTRDAELAARHCESLTAWVEGLGKARHRQGQLAQKIAQLHDAVAAWDDAKVVRADKAEKDALENLHAAEKRQAAAQHQHESLAQQLGQIQGGVCPFLKDTCRQFDTAKVQADLDQYAAKLPAFAQELREAQAAHTGALTAATALRTAQFEINGKRQQLTECLAAYRDNFAEFSSDASVETVQWLITWDAGINALPVVPAASAAFTLAAVTPLQAELHAAIAQIQSWWQHTHSVVSTRLKAHREAERARHAEEAACQDKQRLAAKVLADAGALAAKASAKLAEAARHDSTAQQRRNDLSKNDEMLKAFATLDADLFREQERRDVNRAGHDKYLGCKNVVDDLPARLERLARKQTELDTAQAGFEAATRAVEQAQQNFDPEKLAAARREFDTRNEAVISLRLRLQQAQAEVQKEERRYNEWRQACADRETVNTEIARCDAALDITELARKTLRDTAPSVAQHLCSRIAAHAQRIFNQISPEPIGLTWDANHYSLRIAPGERRFAMLSGGEQTKLALAMTLAMIEEFSGLRFCVFDEPTYGVDAESRHKLADAILHVHEAAGLQQLLLVSHDDAFEDKIEHAIILEKSAVTGTQVVPLI